MQARYYDPVIGRFYSNDPVGFKGVHSFNRYAYANNNPYRYTDPDGREAVQLAVTLNVPAVTELLPDSVTQSVQGIQVSANFSFPGASGTGKYGFGLSLDGVVGTEVGTEADPRSNSKFSVTKFFKSLLKTSLTGGADFNWTKSGVTDVQNGISDPKTGGNVVIAGGNISINGSGEITGAEFSIGAGVNGGSHADLPIIGIAIEEDKGITFTGEAVNK